MGFRWIPESPVTTAHEKPGHPGGEAPAWKSTALAPAGVQVSKARPSAKLHFISWQFWEKEQQSVAQKQEQEHMRVHKQ